MRFLKNLPNTSQKSHFSINLSVDAFTSLYSIFIYLLKVGTKIQEQGKDTVA